MLIRYLRHARADLDDIYDYVSQDNPEAAARVVERIRASIELLADFPNLGRPGRLADSRELIIAGLPYIVPYRAQAGQVIIIRVLHTSRQRPPI